MRWISVFGLILLLQSLMSIGCSRDRELTQMQSEVTQAASDLVIQDAAARREIISMQAALDAERRLLNERERQDPIVAEAIMQIGGLVLCLLPLAVIAWLLCRSDPEAEVTVLNELVIDELLIDELLVDPASEPVAKRIEPPDSSRSVQEHLAGHDR